MTRFKITSLVFLLFTLALSFNVFSKTYIVDDLVDSSPDSSCLAEEDGGGTCNLREAIDLSNSDTTGDHDIYLPSSTISLSVINTSAADEDLNQTGDLDLLNTTSQITIVGGGIGISIIDAASLNDRIFDINSTSAHLILQDLTIQNGYSNYYGGAIYNLGTLEIDTVSIDDNEASYGGGAIYNYNSCQISNSKLSGNKASAEGGAIYHYNKTIDISNTVIENNTSASNGGSFSSYAGDVTIDNCQFMSNESGSNGGAINIYSGTSSFYISNSLLNDNLSNYMGGAINSTATTVISNTTIIGNNSTDYGGAISTSFADITIRNSNISNNSSDRYAGAIYFSSSSGEFSDTIFRNNTDAYHTGGISNYYGSILNLSRCTFIRNSSSSTGSGAIYSYSSDLFVYECDFIRNESAGAGGAIAFSTGTLDIYDSTFRLNSSSYNSCQNGGGALYNYGGTATIKRSTFELNEADNHGGAIHNRGSCEIENSTFYRNKTNQSTSYGGAIKNDNNINLAHVTIHQNQGYSGAGGYYNSSSANLLIKNSIVSQNIDASFVVDNSIGTITSYGYNICTDTTCGFTATTDLFSTNPRLDSAGTQMNGGDTETIIIHPSSSALNAIPEADCTDFSGNYITEDQRSYDRPYSRDSSNACDIGALELQ
ncbi:MAG: right-handed parallel beta-helix repeat-containing protein [Pseudomonadota bacterium]